MKPYHLLILLFICSALTRCKTEEVKPEVATQSNTTTNTSIKSQDTTTNTPVTPPGGQLPEDHIPLGNPTLLVAKWGLVKDSTYSWFPTPDTVAHITKYMGVDDDYYDFRHDGKCYTKVAGVYDTLAYQMTGVDQVVLQKFGPNMNGHYVPSTISQYTDHHVTIYTSGPPNPAGRYYRELELKR